MTNNHTKKFYLCGRYGRKEELQECAIELRNMGHIVVSSWVDFDDNLNECNLSDKEKCEIAMIDIEDLESADILVVFSEEENSTQKGRGGRHVEMGMAIALRKDIDVIGPKENIFHYADIEIKHYDNWTDYLCFGSPSDVVLSIDDIELTNLA